MAKEIRDIIAMHEKQARDDAGKLARLGDLRALVDYAEQTGVLSASMPRAEVVGEPQRFSDEARESLTKEGYRIYTLTGQSIASLRGAGRKFWSTWHKDYPDFEALTSQNSEVAINPDQLFIPKSNNKTLDEQLEIMAKFSKDLAKKVKGVVAVIGGAPDYVDLAFTHLDATGDRLFGEKYNYNYARTQTPTVGASVASVGHFDDVGGLNVRNWRRDDRDSNVFASPLVVPKR